VKPAESENVAGPSRLAADDERQRSAAKEPAFESQDAQEATDDDDDGDEPEYDPDDDGGAGFSDFPISHHMVMKDHTKVVSALALDPSGARVVSGSHDYDCKLWDFGGMTASAKPFKTWEPAGTYYVRLFLQRYSAILG
jgi:WD40 repeat protein